MFKIIGLCLLALHIFIFVKNGFRIGWGKYIVRVLIAIDQFYNVYFGGCADETISSRCARGYNAKWYWKMLGNLLEWLDPGHLKQALESERLRRHLPLELQ